MMTAHTKRKLDTAIDELKRNGYAVIVVLLDQKADESRALGSAVEVLCSETNNPQILGAMLKTVMGTLSDPAEADRRIN